jgi:hypothetical protein
MFYAIVFTQDFKPGEHWTDHLPEPAKDQRRLSGKHRAASDDADRKQHWRAGDLYSTGTVIAVPMPKYLEAITCDPPADGQVWDRERRMFVTP